MSEIYIVNNQLYSVSQDRLQDFLNDFPNAVKQSDKSQKQEEKVNWFDQTWLGRGIAAASTTGEASDVFLEGSNVTLETVQDFIRAREQQARTYVESERMKRFMKQYNDEGKTWTAFLEV